MNRLKAMAVACWVTVSWTGLGSGQTPSASEAQTEPVNMGPIINSMVRDAEPTFTPDGNTMYFNCYDRPGRTGGDICVSTRLNGAWSEPGIVGAPISTEYSEIETPLSPDGT